MQVNHAEARQLGLSGIPVRFFVYDEELPIDEFGNPLENETEQHNPETGFGGIVECDESTFLEAVATSRGAYRITYERHTVRENGVSQICLTAAPEF